VSGSATLGVCARSHDPNHTEAFTAQLQVYSLLVHVAGVGYSCTCFVEGVAQVGTFSIIHE
jgi:hypothetical protein